MSEIKRGRPRKGSGKPKKVKVTATITEAEIAKASEGVAKKVEENVRLTPVETALVNREKIGSFIGEHLATHFELPTIVQLSEGTGISRTTCQKYMRELLTDNKTLKMYAKHVNGQVMARHFKMIMDDERVSPAYVREWYDRFMDDEDTANRPKEAGKIVINIVTAKPKEIQVEEAKIVED